MSLETADRITRLQWFARRVLDMGFEASLDGSDAQAAALKAGLIREETATEENQDNWPEHVELGDPYYMFSEDLSEVDWDQLKTEK